MRSLLLQLAPLAKTLRESWLALVRSYASTKRAMIQGAYLVALLQSLRYISCVCVFIVLRVVALRREHLSEPA